MSVTNRDMSEKESFYLNLKNKTPMNETDQWKIFRLEQEIKQLKENQVCITEALKAITSHLTDINKIFKL